MLGKWRASSFSCSLFFPFTYCVLLLLASSFHCPVKQKEGLMQQSVSKPLSLAQHKHSRHWLRHLLWGTAPQANNTHTHTHTCYATSVIDKAWWKVIGGIRVTCKQHLTAGINAFFSDQNTWACNFFTFKRLVREGFLAKTVIILDRPTFSYCYGHFINVNKL